MYVTLISLHSDCGTTNTHCLVRRQSHGCGAERTVPTYRLLTISAMQLGSMMCLMCSGLRMLLLAANLTTAGSAFGGKGTTTISVGTDAGVTVFVSVPSGTTSVSKFHPQSVRCTPRASAMCQLLDGNPFIGAAGRETVLVSTQQGFIALSQGTCGTGIPADPMGILLSSQAKLERKQNRSASHCWCARSRGSPLRRAPCSTTSVSQAYSEFSHYLFGVGGLAGKAARRTLLVGTQQGVVKMLEGPLQHANCCE